MNRKGFTLVELLAVIVILAVVMVIGGVSISSIKNKIDKNLFEEKIEQVLVSAKEYGADNKSTLDVFNKTNDNDKPNCSKFITIDTLLSTEYLDAEDNINHYITGEPINSLNICVYLLNNRAYACIPEGDNGRSLLEPNGKTLAKQDVFCSN